jgi:hypothetical protein
VTSMVIYRAEDGKLAGFGERGRRAWLKFIKKVQELEIGETLQFEYRLPRSPVHHSFFFLKLTGLFERQERFDDLDRMLDWLKVGAGHVDLLPGRDGQMVAIPKSIAWHKLEEQEFIEFCRAMNDFLWTPYAQEALWPHLKVEQRYECIDNWHTEFQRT